MSEGKAPPSTERVTGGLAGFVRPFLESHLAVLLVIVAVALGAMAIAITPREEDPQIVVPLADVFVSAPGVTAREVERLVATPLERLLWQIDGVEHVYSRSAPGMAVVTVRFYVGEDRERSLVKLHNKISMNEDEVPPLVRGWVIKPVEIDDVPILALTLSSDRYDDHMLRRMAEELLARLAVVPEVSRTSLYGGRPQVIRVELDPEILAGRGLTPLAVSQALAGADASLTVGAFDRDNQSFTVTSDAYLQNAAEVRNLVVGVHQARPVYLSEVARVYDGPAEVHTYTRLGFSERWRQDHGQEGPAQTRPAVTVGLAKKRGTNAVTMAANVLSLLEELKGKVLPAGVEVTVTRNYGETAKVKSDELIQNLGFAVVTVVALLAFTLGWREALVVAFAVPLSFALSLFVNYLIGYTINRVTMFALILSLGLVVDDPIINVDNIQRHIFLGRREPKEATLAAVNEVLPPVIMSTLAIIVSFTPMFFITGMMGPYMAPMAANVPLTVTFSTLWALTVVPWLCYKLLKDRPAKEGVSGEGRDVTSPLVRRLYRRVLTPFLNSRTARWLFLLVILVLLAASLSLVVLRQVPLKMLPFDNKNEFQLVLDLPAGTTLETTDRATADFENFLAGVPEVTDFTSYVGLASPMDFNGMVRHYYLRQGPNVAEIRVNLVGKDDRQMQSHEILLRLRNGLKEIAHRHKVNLKLVENPPGPPVLSTLVAEIYGEPDISYRQLIASGRQVGRLMATESLVVDIDNSSIAEHGQFNFVLDKEKAALHGISAAQVVRTLELALSGQVIGTLHRPLERQALPIRLILPRDRRSSLPDLARVTVAAADGSQLSLAELGAFHHEQVEQPIYHKDLKPVVFVYADVAGRSPVTAVLDLEDLLQEKPLAKGVHAVWDGEGEWQITLRVFRDLGLAFGAALVGIFVLLVIQTGSFSLPLLLMVAIPLTLLGILPGFWLLNLAKSLNVDGYPVPIFFTATSMIGMIALGGIVIRNSVVLIDFIQTSLKEGLSFKEAILESGAVRFRPIILTAMTTALGAWPITLDPIFSGLAWALIFGLGASTAFTLLVVPVTYYALNHKQMEAGE